MSGLRFDLDDDVDTSNGRRGFALAVMGFITVVVVLLVLLAGPVRHLFGSGGDYSGAGSGSVTVVIHDGDSVSTIGHTLASAGVVRSSSAFTSAASMNPKARLIGPGTYRLREHMRASLAVSLLLNPSARVGDRVTIPEGFTASEIVDRLAAETSISKASLTAAVSEPSSLGLPPYSGGKAEGFLFPATYDVEPGQSADSVLRAMVQAYDQAATDVHLAAGAKRLGLTEYQVLILASMVQAEGRLIQDYPKIASVFLNRLKAGMPFGSDATLVYAVGHAPLTSNDLASNSPYNTRYKTGFPPTPINSPGEAALTAVLHPAHTQDLYFVTIDKQGHTAYARTLGEFNQLVAQSRANGVQ